MNQLEKEFNYKDSHFDFIQQHLRRICLTYGASLVYTSAKKNVNCDVLLQYIHHKLYNFDFTHKAQLMDKDSLLIPAGFDSVSKITTDFDNQDLTKDADDSFEEIIKIPKIVQQQSAESNSEAAVAAEEDQEFLRKYKEVIDSDAKEDKNKNQAPGSGLFQSLQRFGGIASPEKVENNATHPAAPSTSSPDPKARLPPSPAPSPGAADRGEAQTPASEHQVLADFFNSLINKDRTPIGGNARPNTSVSKPADAPSKGKSKEDIAKQLEAIKNKKS